MIDYQILQCHHLRFTRYKSLNHLGQFLLQNYMKVKRSLTNFLEYSECVSVRVSCLFLIEKFLVYFSCCIWSILHSPMIMRDSLFSRLSSDSDALRSQPWVFLCMCVNLWVNSSMDDIEGWNFGNSYHLPLNHKISWK